MVTTSQLMSIEELERTGGPEGRWELINGELVAMAAAGGEHGRVNGTIHSHLGSFALAGGLGYVYSSETGFVLAENPPTVRAPDLSFIRTERLPDETAEVGFLRVSPDLVVEVISPTDRIAEVLIKVGQWLAFGVPMIWLVALKARTVTVYRPDREPRTLTVDQVLDGEEVVPGFTLPVREIFARV